MSIENIIKKYNLGEKARDIRRYLHQNPELSENEFGTRDYICGCLEKWGIEFKTGYADTGVVAIVRGKGSGRVVGLRGDMDALPIKEETGLPFASVNDGVMHACGHDSHVTILLITAIILNEIRDEFKGCVKFFFQPAEETIGGSHRMILDGCLKDPEVDYILGLHVEPKYNTGKVGIRYGKMYAASDMIDITVKGSSAHGAHPDEGVDAICVAANIINAAQTLVSRNISPLNSAVCTFGKIQGGTVRNQIASEVKMEGIIRTLDQETRLFARERLRKLCFDMASAFGAEIEFDLMESYGPTINDDRVTSIVEENAVKLLGKENIILEDAPDLSCEDFSYFAMEKPACYFHLGCYDKKNGPRVDLHNPVFTIDEDCLMIGVRLQIENVLTLLERGILYGK
ncbi:MAG: amidohydrolase [Clostridiales bacterium]|nr:amidohydrolase [Clostridiales bacterium]